jgi:hypothetical protein
MTQRATGGVDRGRTVRGLSLDLPLSTGDVVRVEFSIGSDLMHVRYAGHGAAVINRTRLRRWLVAPHGEWATDEVIFTADGDHVGLMLRGLGWWQLTVDAVHALRAAV